MLQTSWLARVGHVTARAHVWLVDSVILTILGEPLFSNEAAVADDADAGKIEVLLAESHQLSQVVALIG